MVSDMYIKKFTLRIISECMCERYRSIKPEWDTPIVTHTLGLDLQGE